MDVYLISRDFSFAASHQILTLPEGHKCARLHGHSYLVRAELTGPLDPRGMVLDYGELDWFDELIASELDHRHLNDVLDSPPTAEHLSRWLWNALDHRVGTLVTSLGVGVSESPKTWAWYRGDNA